MARLDWVVKEVEEEMEEEVEETVLEVEEMDDKCIGSSLRSSPILPNENM
jgi:hypothetical protein